MHELDDPVAQGKSSDVLQTSEARSSGVRRAIAWCRSLGPIGRGSAAFLLYALVSVVAYAHDDLPHFASRCVTTCATDTRFFIWSLGWMPYAIAHGINPFHTDILSAPGSIDLTWVVTVPGPALVMAPVTMVFGPVASDNVLLVAAPALAGWGAYLVCNQVTRRFWPSVAGGFVFGFSPYIGRYMRAQLHVLLVFPAALAVYLILRRIDGSIGKRAFVALLALVLAAQLFISAEVFATMTLFGAIALLGAFVLGPRLLRKSLLSVAGLIALSYVAVGAAVSPYLYEMVRHAPSGLIRNTATSSHLLSTDLLSFVLPHRSTWIGGQTFAGIIPHSFIGNANMAYLGPGFILVLILFAWGARRHRTTWLLLGFVAATVVLSLGPRLHVAGIESIPMPGAMIASLPFMRNAVPYRWVEYVWLAMAIIVALWLCGGRRRTVWVRYVVVGLGILLTIQQVNFPPTSTDLSVPAFFTDGTYRSYIEPDEIVLPITQTFGDDLLWQAETEMYFRMPQGTWLLVTIAAGRERMTAWIRETRPSHPLVSPPSPEAFVEFLEQHHVQTIVAANPLPSPWTALLRSAVSTKPVRVGGVSVYRVP
jgi:hypothetical protein